MRTYAELEQQNRDLERKCVRLEAEAAAARTAADLQRAITQRLVWSVPTPKNRDTP